MSVVNIHNVIFYTDTDADTDTDKDKDLGYGMDKDKNTEKDMDTDMDLDTDLELEFVCKISIPYSASSLLRHMDYLRRTTAQVPTAL
jgi:hypothetical protein